MRHAFIVSGAVKAFHALEQLRGRNSNLTTARGLTFNDLACAATGPSLYYSVILRKHHSGSLPLMHILQGEHVRQRFYGGDTFVASSGLYSAGA